MGTSTLFLEMSTEQWVAVSFALLLCVLFIVAGAWWWYYKIRLGTRISWHGKDITNEPLPSPADETEIPPPLLCIDSPKTMRCCEGEYDFVMKYRCNQQPCWLKKDGSRLILSGSDGHWHIARHRGSSSTDFTRVVRLICSQRPHDGAFPHQIASGWTIKRNFHWRVDPSISVQAPVALFREDPMPVDPETLDIDHRHQSFTSCSHHSVTACSNPFMCSIGNKSGKNEWIAGAGEAGRVHGQANSDLTTASTWRTSLDNVQPLAISHQKTSQKYLVQTVAEAPRKMQDCHAVAPGACPVDPPAQRRLPQRLPPQALRVSVPSRQTSCSGLYVLVPNEQPNGHPLWRQESPEPVRWLFCDTSGRWSIGGADVQRECFSQGAVYVTQTLPSGPDVFPHDCETLWQLWDSDNKRLREDSAIQVTQADLTSWDIAPPINNDANELLSQTILGYL